VPLVLGIAAIVGLGLVVLFLFDPARHAIYPVCLFKKMTGYDCPGCGGLRALHQLLRGEVWQAFQLNALAVVALPLLIAWAIRSWIRSPREAQGGYASMRWLAWLFLAALVGFAIVRNLPFWPFGVTPM
jgi:hypothetical protein